MGGFAEAYGIKKDADGNYLVSAYGFRAGRTGAEASNSVDALLFSLKPNGSLNRSWADNGLVAYHIGDNGNNSGDRHRDHVILPDGRIVGVGGTSGTANALITVTQPDGTPGFTKVLDFGGTDDYLWAVTTVGNGNQVIAAGYGNGDARLVTFDLTPTPSTTTVSLAKSAPAFGAANSVTVRLAVDGAQVAGKVAVTLDGKPVKTLTVGTSGSASLALPRTLTAGAHKITATLSATPGIAGSKASATATVVKAPSTTSLKLSASKIKKKKRATATIKVAGIGTPAGYYPTGTVTIYDGTKKIATVTLPPSAKGTIKIKLSKLSVKTHTIKVAYAGNTNLKASAATAKIKVVK